MPATSAEKALRQCLTGRRDDFIDLADAVGCSPGELLDFQLGLKSLTAVQLERLARGIFHGGVVIKGDRLHVLRAVGLTPVWENAPAS